MEGAEGGVAPAGRPQEHGLTGEPPFFHLLSQVVGIVRDDRHDGPRSEPVPEIFIPHAENPYLVLNVIARTAMDPLTVAQAARVNAIDS